MSKFLKGVCSIVCVGVVAFAIYKAPFILGSWGNKVEEKVGTEYQDIKREQFEHSKSYIHSKVSDLQKYKRELERTEDKTERMALIIHIQDEFANFDSELIESQNLRSFLYDIQNGNIQ